MQQFLFSFTGIALSNTKDCFEGVNRAVFTFNMGLDKVVFKPIARGYSYLPGPVRTGVRNVTNNVSHLVQVPNQFLQGKFSDGIKDTGRFIVNTTFGIFGFFNLARGPGTMGDRFLRSRSPRGLIFRASRWKDAKMQKRIV